MTKVVLISGAGRGIGRGIAQALAKNGWVVVVNYRINQSAAEETLRIVEDMGGIGLLVQADISLEADRQRLTATTIDQFGQIDLLVNNAGMAPRRRLDILEIGEES